jgi:hypothetical protein
LGAVLWGGVNGILAGLGLIGAASFLVRLRSGLHLLWCVAVPGAVALSFTAPFIHRGAAINVVIDGIFTLLVAVTAAVGALLARRRRAGVQP